MASLEGLSVMESLVCGDSDKLMHTMWSFRTGLASISVDGHLASAYAWMKYISRWPLGSAYAWMMPSQVFLLDKFAGADRSIGQISK
jgi:hypothetical protein